VKGIVWLHVERVIEKSTSFPEPPEAVKVPETVWPPLSETPIVFTSPAPTVKDCELWTPATEYSADTDLLENVENELSNTRYARPPTLAV